MAADQYWNNRLNTEIHRIMGVIAKRMGRDELPMKNPDINFYRVAESILRNMGFKGQKLNDATSDVIHMIALKGEPDPKRPDMKIKEGSLFSYPRETARREKEGLPVWLFDKFFMTNVRQKGLKVLEREQKDAWQKGRSIGRGDDEGGVPENALPSSKSTYDEVAEAADAKVVAGIPDFLASKGNGRVMVLVWDLLTSKHTGGEKWTLKDVAEELNNRGFKTARGGDWTHGSVHSIWEIAQDLVKRYLKRSGIDWKSMEASRISGLGDRGR